MASAPLAPAAADVKLDPELERWAAPLLTMLQRYHRHQVVGLTNLPRTGPVVLAASHSLATYDGFLMGWAIYQGTGRLPAGLGDDLIFKIPGLKDLALGANIYPANPQNGRALLEAGHVLGLAPGGMRESLRPSTERYQVRWAKRRGFVRLALQTGAPIVLAATPAADDIFEVYESRVTKVAYKRLKVPVPVARGLGLSPLPRPVELTSWISEPIHPPPLDPAHEEAQVEALHALVCERMNELMAQHRGG